MSVTIDNKKTYKSQMSGRYGWEGSVKVIGREGRREEDEVEMLRRRWKISVIPGV